MEIQYSPLFAKNYKNLPVKVKFLAEQKEKIFRENVFAPELRTHKLKGKMVGLWSFSVNHQYRVVFEFVAENLVQFHNIGSHEIYF